jgi:lipopolysaccharide heptosyltransferase I
MKILIVKLGAIGDIVHTLPVLAAIRHEMPQSEISWIVERRSAEILRGNQLIDNLIEVDTRSIRGKAAKEILPEIASQLKELRKFKFDIALDLQGLLKSGMIAKLSGARRRWGFSKKALREPSSRIFLTKTVEIPPQTHIIRKNLRLAAEALKIPVPNGNFEFPIFTSGEHRLESEKMIEKTGNEFAILNPAGGWVTKLWHAEKFGSLADRIFEKYGILSVVATGPNEGDLAETVRQNSRPGRIVLAQPSLKGFFELAKRAKIYVGGDTGPTHIAVAAGAPVVGLFGPTEWWRNGSPDPSDICVERTDIACRIDCHRRQCANWICMDSDVETVFGAVIRRIAV